MKHAVAVIAYSAEPPLRDIASFMQCVTVLRRHDIHLVCPVSLDPGVYENILERHGVRAVVQRFADTYFQSVASYNKLMRTAEFYERFAGYDYMLLHQLDAWVFYDALDEWCAKGWDYIGAPLYSDRRELFPYAGNGGFSLRRIPTFISLLRGELEKTCAWDSSFLRLRTPCKNAFTACVRRAQHLAEAALCRLSPSRYLAWYRGNEDIAYAKTLTFIKDTRPAPPEEALLFSFERFPELNFERTGGKLPFGCHAFAKYQPEFWARHIPCLTDFGADSC